VFGGIDIRNANFGRVSTRTNQPRVARLEARMNF